MFVPVRLCPSSSPLVRSPIVKDEPLTVHVAVPVILHVSSIGNGVRLGRYVTLRGPSITVPVQF